MLPPLERASERRDDAAALAAAAARPDALLLPLHGARSLVSTDHGGALRARFVAPSAAGPAPLIWLGELGGKPLFTADLAEPLEADGCGWDELRRALPLLPAEDFALLAYARALVHWHRSHRHCGACGTLTEVRRGGHERGCPACGLALFPRTDPAVIVVVGDERRCLLGRQAQWEPGRYSALAGFVEPGETLEEAVAREVREETGVAVGAPRYFGGQPWPFPTSLMVGFHAEPLPGDGRDAIHLDGRELEDARWFTRMDLVAGLTAGTLKLSTRRSIAYRLIEDWFDRAGMPLAGVPGA